MFCPLLERLVEQVTRQSVHLADVSMTVDRLREQVVCSEMVAVRDDQTPQVVILARHPVQRVDTRHHSEIRDQVGLRPNQQFTPRSIHRHRLDVTAVRRESPTLDNAAVGQVIHRRPVCRAVERHRQIQVAQVHTDCRGGERHPLRFSAKLDHGRNRTQTGKVHVTVGEDMDFASRNSSMNPTCHLQQLIRPEVLPRQNIPAAIDEVRELRILDNDCIQTVNVQRGLSGSRHRQHERFLCSAIQERSNYANGLPAVVMHDGEAGPAPPHLCRHILDLGTRGQEYRNSPLLALHAPNELYVEKVERLARLHGDASRQFRIECGGLEHVVRAQVARIERRIYGRRKPDIRTPNPLPQRQAQLQLGRCLMNLVYH